MTFTPTIDVDPDVYEVNDPVLTATQCKMARAALGWNRNYLAERASVSVDTIADFENGRDMPIPAKLAALRRGFDIYEEVGIVRFTKGGGFEWRNFEGDDLLTRKQCRWRAYC